MVLGAGLFAAPDAIMEDALRARGLQRVGSIDALRERYYAISIERKLAHPAVVAIVGAACGAPSLVRLAPAAEAPAA